VFVLHPGTGKNTKDMSTLAGFGSQIIARNYGVTDTIRKARTSSYVESCLFQKAMYRVHREIVLMAPILYLDVSVMMINESDH